MRMTGKTQLNFMSQHIFMNQNKNENCVTQSHIQEDFVDVLVDEEGEDCVIVLVSYT